MGDVRPEAGAALPGYGVAAPPKGVRQVKLEVGAIFAVGQQGKAGAGGGGVHVLSEKGKKRGDTRKCPLWSVNRWRLPEFAGLTAANKGVPQGFSGL